jgi:hypothetical protein
MTVDRVVIIAGKRVAGPPPTPAAQSHFPHSTRRRDRRLVVSKAESIDTDDESHLDLDILSFADPADVEPLAAHLGLTPRDSLPTRKRAIPRSKIFCVKIHGRFDTESIEIGLQPPVSPFATLVVKKPQEIPISV